MRKRLFSAVMIVAAMVLLSAWFWALGTVPSDTRTIQLILERDAVEIRPAGSTEWRKAQTGMILHEGDAIRTDAAGRATIEWYDRGETRLAEQTELVITQATSSPYAVPAMSFHIDIMRGRAWQRFLHLIDLESTAGVRTTDAVATVRGTAFDVSASASGTALSVYQAIVEQQLAVAMPGTTSSVMVPEGMWVKTIGGRLQTVESLPTTQETDAWVTRNLELDGRFLARVRDGLSYRYEGKHPQTGYGMRTALARASERLHLVFAGAKAPMLEARYIGRRFFEIRRQVENGRSGLALQSVGTIEQDIRSLLEASGAEQPMLARAVGDALLSVSDAIPSSPFFRLKQRLEDVNFLVAEADPASALYARLVRVDDRLDEAAALLTSGGLEEAGLSLDAARDGLRSAGVDMKSLMNTLPSGVLEALTKKMDAEAVRLRALQDRLSHVLTQPPGLGTGAEDAATSTLPMATSTQPDASATTTPPFALPSVITSLRLVIQPNPVFIGNRAVMKVVGVRGDGTTTDVTNRATFEITSGSGSLAGSIFEATKAGTVSVRATVMESGTALTATSRITSVDSLALSALTFTANPTTLRVGERAALKVVAKYASGATEDVTSKVVWTMSDPNSGLVSQGVFVPTSVGSGRNAVTASYSSGGVTKTTVFPFTILAQ